MTSFYQQLARHARQIPHYEALVEPNLAISFGELPALVDRYHDCLIEAGLHPGAIVGLNIRSEIPHLLVTLALFKLDAHQVTLPSHETQSYRDSLVERLNVSHLLSLDEALDPRAPQSRQFDVKKVQTERVAPVPVEATVYSTTSGTTKGPRIIAATEEIMSARAERHDGIRSQRVLVTASVEHSTVKRRRLRCLFVGSTSLFFRKPGTPWADLAAFINEKNATVLQLSPLDANRFSRNPGAAAPLQVPIFIAGTRISWASRQTILKNLSPLLYVRYGASECGSIAMAGPGEHDERETVGRPQPSVTVEIIGYGRRLAPGEIGEIRIKAPGTIAGYHDDPVETAARFRDGWFYPGDMGSLTEDGELIIQGRKDDMMIMNSINIYPSEIERVLEAHPAVSAAAAFAIRSGLHGDIPAVAVELTRGAVTTEDSLMQYARDRLGLRYPRKVIILDKLPRSATGKILKNDIVASSEREALPA